MSQTYDVFISHASADKPWVRTLALNLHNFGLEVWFDEWRIGRGDVLVHELDAGILNSLSGVIVVAEAAMNRLWVLEEYAAMMKRAVKGKQRVIPVLVGTAEMPPLLASRLYIDFRGADGAVYETRVKELATALKGEKEKEDVEKPPEPVFDFGVVVPRVGEFVGRRREQRQCLSYLNDKDGCGILIYGISGVGKSALSAQVLHKLAQDKWDVVSVSGELNVDRLLSAFGMRLFSICLNEGRSENDPCRQIAAILRRPDIDWQDRFMLLSDHVLGKRKIALLLDNFDSNIDEPPGTVKDENLASLISLWLRHPGQSRIIITCRYIFQLPHDAHRRLMQLSLGPMSLSETRKLVTKLTGLSILKPDELRRIYETVGGHPLVLQIILAQIRGKARFSDIEEKLIKALKKDSITDPGKWTAEYKGNLDKAIAETITLAIAQIEPVPLAKRLLIGASVYRVPVDEDALYFQLSSQPVNKPDGFDEAKNVLEIAGLLSKVHYTDQSRKLYIVHRLITAAFSRLTDKAVVKESHHSAARYWRWHVDKTMLVNKEQAYEELLEARYHHYEAGELDLAVEASEWVCSQFSELGMWSREEQIIKETLTWLPARSEKAAAFTHHLGILAQNRGSYDEALTWYRKALEIKEELGNRADMASSYHQVGMIAELKGSYDEALTWYRKAMEIFEELGNRSGLASSYVQLGNVARNKGNYDEALT